jgi:aminoglycoside phosphotransferase family enzyme/predicted kinase
VTSDHDSKAVAPSAHVVGDQEEVFRFLATVTAGAGGDAGTRVDTHGAVVLLGASDAYKTKRAVKFPFMDLSTIEKRRRACEAEVRINRAFAPDLYLGAIPVVRRDGALHLDGAGEIVEWVVHMRRFDERQTLDRIADRGELTAAMVERMAAAVALSQTRARVWPGVDFAAHLGAVIDGDARDLDEAPELFEPPRVASLTTRSRQALARVAPLLARRSAEGFVRRCHGDLHLRNIVKLGDTPTLFDALEFDETLATIDVLYDFAFLLMDLVERGLVGDANHLFNRYLVEWRDERQLSGLAALPLFVSVRAAIRAKVIAAGLAHLAADERPRSAAMARRYFALAESALATPAPRLIAIGGLSGTGKSTLAARLAPDIGRVPGAVHLRSDVERKHLFDVAEYDRLPASAYDQRSGDAVYDILRRKTERALAAGYSVVVDAVHQRAEEREALRLLAARLGVAFTGLWLDAPLPDLVARVSRRTHDASDAQADTVALQARRGTGAIDWRRIDAGGDGDLVLERARLALSARL